MWTMPLPSKFLMAGARSMTLKTSLPTISSAQVLSSRSYLLSVSENTHFYLRSLISRQYSTPEANPLDSGPNLLDKAPDWGTAFTLPPPPTPLPPPSVTDAATASMTELGLGGYLPPGLVQEGLNYLHSLGLPWWSCIVVGALIIRPLMIPLFAAVQRNSVNMLNNAPELQQFQMRTLAAHSVGDRVGVLRIGKEQRKYMKDHDISHFRQLRLICFQGAVFVSMFWGLRGMAELPIESFKTGGILHIMDLTTRDPYFILPSIVSFTMYIILRSGAEGIAMDDFPKWLRIMLTYGIPILTFLPVAYFPAAMGIYWVTSNLFSLLQAVLFRSDFGKKIFRIPERRIMPDGYGKGLDNVTFAEQFAKMQQVAQEAAKTQVKLQSFELPDDSKQWSKIKVEEGKPTMPSLSPEEVAARHTDIKKMIKEINEMKRKVEEMQPELRKMEDTQPELRKMKNASKPPDIHIKIPKDKIE